MFDLRSHYDKMFQDASDSFSKNHYVLDHLIDDVNDNRFGLILNARPTQEIKNNVEVIQRRFKAIDPTQYYYPPDDLHFTVIAIISCKPAFTISGLDIDSYKQIIQDALWSIDPFEINCSGVTAFSGGIMVQGFPSEDKLNLLRDSLRRKFNASSLFHTIDSRYRIQTAHSTIIRFRNPVQNIQLLRQLLLENRTMLFGNFVVEEIELVYSDWYQRKKNSTVLGKFKL